MGNEKKKKQEIVCLCMGVSRETIESAICHGAHDMGLIFDRTTAGVGPCGGSCKPKLQLLLESYLQTGQFPDSLKREDKRK